MQTILVTGGAGYIGSHAVVELLDNNYDVVVIDTLENGFKEFVDKRAKFYQGNVQDFELMSRIFQENKIEAVMHFAGYIRVPESVDDPNKYYFNNTYTTMCLIQSMVKHNVKNIIFSSTAAVYGEIIEDQPIDEKHSTVPINPYGASKHKSFNIETLENIITYLKDKDTAIILTYFGDKYKELEFLEKKYKYVYIPKKIESIIDTAILIKKSDYVISPDTSIVHIASAFNKKMITIYPPKGGKYGVDHLVWEPKSKYNKVIFCKDKTGTYDEIDINTFNLVEMKKEILKMLEQ